MTDLLTGYVVPAAAIAVPGGIEDYFAEINAARGDDERGRIGQHYGTPRRSRTA